MKRLNFKTSLPSKRPLAQRNTAARARPKSLRKYKDLIWDSVRFGKVKRFHSKPRRGRGGYISRCARRSTEGSRHNAYQRHGLHIHNSHHHHWMQAVGGCQSSVSGCQFSVMLHTEHRTLDLLKRSFNGPLKLTLQLDTEHRHHHHGHHHHSHHHHHHRHQAHDGFSSWFFQSFWRVAGLDPYAVCIAKHSAKEIAKLKQRVAHATQKGKHYSISLAVHKAHSPRSVQQNSKTQTNHKTENHKTKDQSPKHAASTKPSYFLNRSKKGAVNSNKPQLTPAVSSLQVTFKVLRKTEQKPHSDTNVKLKTRSIEAPLQSDPKPITYAPGSTIKNPKMTNRITEVNYQRSMIQNQKQKTLHTKSNTGHRTLNTGHSQLLAGHSSQETGNKTAFNRNPSSSTHVGYISSSIPIRLIYPKVTVGAAALPE
jgi:hypothetical protein